MKYIKFLILVLFISACQAQESRIIIEKKLISNWSDYPIYSYLTDTINGQVTWKTQYQYLDQINVYGITYLSDGLKIKGLLVEPRDTSQKYPCIIFNRGGILGL